ncbi:MAG: SpoIIE family protein phosphatase [Acidobacteriaceae bacterium]|nr:SpoIIE family protein phosphatase [Acidobacteriaceae bacterium]
MPEVIDTFVRQQLLERRDKLQSAVSSHRHSHSFHKLLEEVDAALERLEDGSYGICEHCHTAIEGQRLMADPLLRFCLCELTDQQREALEEDLELAARVQRALLPPQDLERSGWQVAYHYEPAGLVSGDYCDVIDAGDAGLYFLVGDVSGKGVAASMVTSHLHAMFRALTSVGLPLKCMLERASRVFRESTLPTQYATLVCGRALPGGEIEIANAGHPPPVIARNGSVLPLEASDLPLGMFANEEFSVSTLRLGPGDHLFVYSDGVSEAIDCSGTEYGRERIHDFVAANRSLCGSMLLARCREDLATFCGEIPMRDDVTLFVLGRA